MKKENIIIFGAGGHAQSCIDVIESTEKYKIVCLIDNDIKKRKILNIKVIKEKKKVSYYKNISKNSFIGVGQIKSAKTRKKIFYQLKKAKYKLPKIISPNSYVSAHAKIGEGSIIMHGAIINSGVKIGRNCIINSRVLIEHNSIIKDNCHISTGAILNGGVEVGQDSFIGSNTVIKQEIKIGENSFVGFGLKIKKNVKKNEYITK